jgi:hypothetical protein
MGQDSLIIVVVGLTEDQLIIDVLGPTIDPFIVAVVGPTEATAMTPFFRIPVAMDAQESVMV